MLYPAVTRARELFAAGEKLLDDPSLCGWSSTCRPIWTSWNQPERTVVDDFISSKRRRAERHDGYIASHRRAWWRVGLHAPAPILATYMARRPPAFVRNLVGHDISTSRTACTPAKRCPTSCWIAWRNISAYQ